VTLGTRKANTRNKRDSFTNYEIKLFLPLETGISASSDFDFLTKVFRTLTQHYYINLGKGNDRGDR
jgi:hypothetical protein